MRGIFLVIFASFSVDLVKGSNNDMKRLKDALIGRSFKYDKDIIPVGEKNEPVAVNHSLTLTYITNLKDGVLSLVGWDSMFWHDYRLRWSPADFGDLRQLNIPIRNLWRPDVLLFNSARKFAGFRSDELNALVQFDGSVSFYNPTEFHSICPFEEDKLDEVNNTVACKLKFGSWTFSQTKLDLKLAKRNALNLDMLEYRSAKSDWQLVDSSEKRNVVQYACCSDSYIDVTYTLNLRKLD